MIVAIAAVLVLPLLFLSNPYRLSILIFILLNIVFGASMRLIMTINQITLGHAAFGAIGGYTGAILATKLNMSFWLILPASGLVAIFFALIVSYPTLRLKGAYFAILTFALSEVFRFVFQIWRGTFGGAFGIVDIPPPNAITLGSFIHIDFSSRIASYYLIAVFTIVALTIMYRIEKSRFGLAFKSIGQSELLTEHTGVNSINYKVLAFTIGSVFAALAGVFQTFYEGLINPMSFTFHQTVHYLIFVVIGGAGYFSGPIIGAIILTALPEVLRPLKEYEPIIYALVLLLSVLYFPQGLMEIWSNNRWIKRVRPKLKRIQENGRA